MDAVIKITKAGCPGNTALNSVADNAHHFKAVHLVMKRRKDRGIKSPLSSDHPAAAKKLEAANTSVFYHDRGSLDESKVVSDATLHIPPYQRFNEDALTQIMADAASNTGSSGIFAIEPAWRITGYAWQAGFLLVLMSIDLIYMVVCGFRHHMASDLQFVGVVHRHHRYKSLESPRRCRWCCFTNMGLRRWQSGSTRIKNVLDSPSCYRDVFQAYRTPFTWTLLYFMIYAGFALVTAGYIYRPVYPTFFTALSYAVWCLFVTMASYKHQFRAKLTWMYVLVSPIYVLLSPFILIAYKVSPGR